MKYNAILIVSFLFVLIVGCSESSLPIGDEARGRLSEVERTRTEQNQRIASLESELTKSREANRRLQAELAAAQGGKGFELEEKQQILDGRKAALDALENQLIERETAIIEREESIVQLENDFYRKTNDAMTDIGEARHVKVEYENMRQEKEDAVATAEFWLMFVWGVSIAFAVAMLAIVVLLYRSVSMHAIQRHDIQHRQQVVDLLSTSVAARLPADDAATVVDALQRISRIG